MSIPSSLTLDSLPSGVRSFVDKWSEHCTPEGVHVCDGSDEEDGALLQLLVEKGSITPLSKLEDWCVYKPPGTMYQSTGGAPVFIIRHAVAGNPRGAVPL